MAVLLEADLGGRAPEEVPGATWAEEWLAALTTWSFASREPRVRANEVATAANLGRSPVVTVTLWPCRAPAPCAHVGEAP